MWQNGSKELSEFKSLFRLEIARHIMLLELYYIPIDSNIHLLVSNLRVVEELKLKEDICTNSDAYGSKRGNPL